MNKLPGLMAMLALVVTGCGSTMAGTPTVGTPVGALPADQVVFQVWSAGGLQPPVIGARSMPGLTIYGNGDMYVADYGDGDGPPTIGVTHADPGEIARFVADVEAGGLIGNDDAYGFPSVTDLPSTAVTLHGADGGTTVSVYGLDESFDEYLDRSSEVRRRADLRDVIDEAYTFVGATQPYLPAALEVFDLGDDRYDTGAPLPTWPGPNPADFAPTGRWDGCAELTDDVESILAAATANSNAGWSTPIGDRILVVKPLLPGDTACD